MSDDRRLIEDYLPIQAISKEASREKSVRKGHISTLHLWWARRPLVACRAAVYGALVPASQFVPENGPDNKKQSLGRANAAKFVTELCKYPGSPRVIAEAQKHVLDAHAERLTAELAEGARTGQWPAWVDEFKWPRGEKQVTRETIEKGRAPRPRVLDMFAGGGAIPLEALRLGCEAYALDLNPVAHIIQLCTLVYPQKYGKPDPTARGMTGPKNAKGETTWGGLAEEVRHWGNWVLEKVKAEICDLYPPIPDPAVWDTAPEIGFDRETGRWNVTKPGKPKRGAKLEAQSSGKQLRMRADSGGDDDDEIADAVVPPGFMQPVAFVWSRTVSCRKHGCGFAVPLVKQSWLAYSKSRTVAARPVVKTSSEAVRFEIVEAADEAGLDFDPSKLGSGKGTSCPKPGCGTGIDLDYIKSEGQAGRFGHQLIAVVCKGSGRNGKTYLSAEHTIVPATSVLQNRLDRTARRFDIELPDEPLEANPRSFDVQNFGFTRWRDVLLPRQLVAMMSCAGAVGTVHAAMINVKSDQERAVAIHVCLSMALGRMADYSTSFCTWQPEFIKNTFNSPGLPMIFDFAEGNPIGGASGSWQSAVSYVAAALQSFCSTGEPAVVSRASATAMPYGVDVFDAVVTDPPYYDSRSYSNLADHFFVWHKRSLSRLMPEHFAGQLTPKKHEAIAARYRHGRSKEKADAAYESLMQKCFEDAHRVLKPGRPLVCVYAHKTTAGWATLINSLRQAGFTVVEAWPVEMERRARQNAQETAALASSIFLVARKRAHNSKTGNYEEEIQPELQEIVRERVAGLWDQDITGADLVVAAVAAGLRAFTKYERVEYANGEEVPAERFLAEVEGVVLDVMLEQIAGKVARGVTAVDPPSRLYVLWRYVYKAAAIDAGEAIVFTYGQRVELDGQKGLAAGRNPLVEKKKSTYRVRDFTERGEDEKLGLPPESGQPADWRAGTPTPPLIDALHRVLWIMEYRPRLMTEFLRESRVNRDQLRVLAQALSGPALKGGELGEVSGGEELAALTKLTSNWKSVIEDALMPLERGAR